MQALTAGFRLMEAAATRPQTLDYAQRGNIQAFIGALPWDQAADEWARAGNIIERIMLRTAARTTIRKDALIGVSSLNALDPVAHQYATQQAGQLVRNISEAQTATLRTILGEAFDGDLTVDGTAKRIRQTIGLHPAWAQAVTNYQANMLARPEAGYSPARWASTVQTRTDKYAERLVRKRALNIARTEIMTAENLGRYATVTAAIRQGSASPGTLKEWSPGPGACRICRRLAGETVQWDRTFSNGSMLPPAHPSCRCTVVFMTNPGTHQPPIDWLGRGDQDIRPTITRIADDDLPALPKIRSDADNLTMDTTYHWSDEKLAQKLAQYGAKGDDAAIDKILALMDERAALEAAQQARDAAAIANAAKPAGKFSLDTNPLTNPAARPERLLTSNEAIGEQFQDLMNTQMAKALDDLNGVFFNNANLSTARAKGFTEETLWTAPWQVANKYASEELKDWWLANGRETVQSFRYKITGHTTDKYAADNVRARGHETGQAGRDRSIF